MNVLFFRVQFKVKYIMQKTRSLPCYCNWASPANFRQLIFYNNCYGLCVFPYHYLHWVCIQYSFLLNFLLSPQVAALSQALTLFDKFKRTQESKEDKTSGPGEKEIDDLATNLQEASQGISTPADKVCAGTEMKFRICIILVLVQYLKLYSGITKV